MRRLSDQSRRLRAAANAIATLGPELEARGPWPLAGLYGTEAEASWGPHELLAHVDEMLPFWLGEAERILAGDPGAAVPFGRVADDPVRIAIIGRDRTVPLRELLSRLAADSRRVGARMADLDDAQAGRRGLHPRLGELSVEELFERFVTGHLEGHVDQLRAILAAAGSAPGEAERRGP